eukprot:CAMPEP_0113480446 /NCGR_PEP_ID=MMETSP0014_2-20120614/21881_1 /TAXON_ID=2857 /ORGANISM="Nitzschia sp." /LENGTH=657 /DNA_ID=CAMNT_0000373879 /DNA_START=79 /DNA_END=2053 /DNA_ORIENTATION=+ /assembly_acc=CAM_ASM_000159
MVNCPKIKNGRKNLTIIPSCDNDGGGGGAFYDFEYDDDDDDDAFNTVPVHHHSSRIAKLPFHQSHHHYGMIAHHFVGSLGLPARSSSSSSENIRLAPTTTCLHMAAGASINTDEDTVEAARTIDTSNDPFKILGIDQPTADTKLIKRAYKRRALKFHPDVSVTQNSSPEQKKIASDRFAKINWAYQTLSGKREQNDKTYGGGSTSSRRGSGTSSSSTGGWSPPHRRSSGYSSSSSSSNPFDNFSTDNFSTDWRDYMPKTNGDDDQYDAGGDSFEKIFSDLFSTAAVGAAGVAGTGANLFVDFIEFLEGNVDGSGSSSGFSVDDNDPELQVLLRTGSFEDVANEMDDTNLVVDQLRSKLTNLEDEILTVTAESKMTTKYMERIELEERLAELTARKQVVNGYLKTSQKRLLALQTRYKELMSQGVNDTYGGGGGGRTSSDSGNNSSSARTDGASSYSSESSYRSSSTSSQETTQSKSSGQQSSQRRPQRDSEDSWMNEGFGSSSSSSTRGSRGRGSSRRRSRSSTPRTSSTATASTGSSRDNIENTRTSSNNTGSTSSSSSTSNTSGSYSSSSSPSPSQNYRRESIRPPSSPPQSSTSTSRSNTPSSSSSLSSSASQANVPPHRRTSSYVSQQEADKKRMQEIKVDEEFEKLKRELGL